MWLGLRLALTPGSLASRFLQGVLVVRVHSFLLTLSRLLLGDEVRTAFTGRHNVRARGSLGCSIASG